ncbi:hypothetical protein REPUB_Repub05bG0108200 [Reevesia pubescens]
MAKWSVVMLVFALLVARVSSRYLPRLSELLGVEVKMKNDCIGEEVVKLVVEIPNEGVLLNENVRFYKEEDKNDPELTKKVASLADTYANDTFGTAHRAHASTNGVAKFLKPYVAGFLMQKELDHLGGAVANPKKPFAVIVDSSKVSTKIGVIESLLAKVDALLIGREMLVTFYKAQGNSFGSSLVEEDKLDLATSFLKKATAKRVSSLLPTDVIIANKFDDDGNCKVIAKKLTDLSGKGVTTIIGGADSIVAVVKVGLAHKMSHISIGGWLLTVALSEGSNLTVVDSCGLCKPYVVFIAMGKLKPTQSSSRNFVSILEDKDVLKKGVLLWVNLVA